MANKIRVTKEMLSKECYPDTIVKHIKGYITVISGTAIRGEYFANYYQFPNPTFITEICDYHRFFLRQERLVMFVDSNKFKQCKHVMDRRTIAYAVMFGEV